MTLSDIIKKAKPYNRFKRNAGDWEKHIFILMPENTFGSLLREDIHKSIIHNYSPSVQDLLANDWEFPA